MRKSAFASGDQLDSATPGIEHRARNDPARTNACLSLASVGGRAKAAVELAQLGEVVGVDDASEAATGAEVLHRVCSRTTVYTRSTWFHALHAPR